VEQTHSLPGTGEMLHSLKSAGKICRDALAKNLKPQINADGRNLLNCEYYFYHFISKCSGTGEMLAQFYKTFRYLFNFLFESIMDGIKVACLRIALRRERV